MAETVNTRALWLIVLATALCVVGSSVMAETLVDPTRPYLQSAPQAGQEGFTTPQVGVGMVVTAKEGTMALLGGKVLRVGSPTEQGVVVQIVPDAVFVRAADGKVTRLPLFPGVSVQVSGQAPQSPPSFEKVRNRAPQKAQGQTRNRQDRSTQK